MATSRRTCSWLTALLAAGCASQAQSLRDVRGAALNVTAAGGEVVPLEELWHSHEATVLVFWSGECPCVRRYQDRVDSLLDRYPGDRVRVVGLASNAGESFAEILRAARERGVRIPIFRDEGGRIAEWVGARSTPTAVLIDGTGITADFLAANLLPRRGEAGRHGEDTGMNRRPVGWRTRCC